MLNKLRRRIIKHGTIMWDPPRVSMNRQARRERISIKFPMKRAMRLFNRKVSANTAEMYGDLTHKKLNRSERRELKRCLSPSFEEAAK